jgi:hypothetical protein
VDDGATNHPSIEQNQSAMRVDRKSLGHFLEVLTLRIFTANSDADVHEHALAATARSSM